MLKHGTLETLKVQGIIFDLDGTLVNSLADIKASVNHVLDRLNVSPLDSDSIQNFVGDGIAALLERCLRKQKSFSSAALKQGLEYYWIHHDAHCLDHTFLYPGVNEVLHHFQSKRMAVITNKAEQFAVKILEGLRINQHFDVVLGGDSVSEKKPSPLPVRKVLEKWQFSPLDVLMVGDGPQDIQSGISAGAKTCAVTYGFHHGPELPADMVIDDLRKLKIRVA